MAKRTTRAARPPRKASETKPAKTAARPRASAKAVVAAQPAPPPPAPPAQPAPPRKPGFYEAVAIYERGVQALQRHDYSAAAELFRAVIDRYPEERELLERAHLYLRVCEREKARQATPPPETPKDHVYAATMALNSGDHAGAMSHLQRALSEDDENDHAHYIMAAALSLRGRRDEAIEHLQRSIALNPDNRSQARQDPDLDNIREHSRFRAAIDAPPIARRKVGARRG